MIEIYAEPSVTHSVKRAFGWSALTLAGEFGKQTAEDKWAFFQILPSSAVPDAIAARFPIVDSPLSTVYDFSVNAREVLGVAHIYTAALARTTQTPGKNGGYDETEWIARYKTRQFMSEDASPTIECSVQVTGSYTPLPSPRGGRRQLRPLLTPPEQPALETRELWSVMWLAYATLDRLRLS